MNDGPVRVAVLGGGIMGGGIALTFARSGYRVAVVEPDADRANSLRSSLRAEFGDLIESVGPDWTPITDAGFVFEAAPEQLDLKKRLWARLGKAAAPAAILATNTSSLDVDALAALVDSPGRVLAAHWFNPAYEIECVEIAPGSQTTPQTLTATAKLLREAGKRPIVVRNQAGFIANRIQFAMIREAILCFEEGASLEDTDEIVRTSFAPRLAALGPLANADLGGLDTYLSIFETLQGVHGARFSPPRSLVEAVASGRLGTKSLAGFSEYSAASASALAELRDARLTAVIATLAPDDEGGRE